MEIIATFRGAECCNKVVVKPLEAVCLHVGEAKIGVVRPIANGGLVLHFNHMAVQQSGIDPTSFIADWYPTIPSGNFTWNITIFNRLI